MHTETNRPVLDSSHITLLSPFPSLASHTLQQPTSYNSASSSSHDESFQTTLLVRSGVKLPRVAEPTGEAYSQAVSVLLPYLLSHRSRLAAFTAATDTTHQATASQTQTIDRSHRATAQHAASRSEFDKASEAAGPVGSHSKMVESANEPGSPVHKQPQEFLAGLQPEQRHRLAVLVDTAILKVQLSACDGQFHHQ